MISIAQISSILECKLIIDLNNVVYYASNPSGKPDLDCYSRVKAELIGKYNIPKENIICICDAPLEYHIEQAEELSELIKSGEVHKCPCGKKADDFILALAQQLDQCFILSNDAFRDYGNEVDLQWLTDHRIAFMIIEGHVLLSPLKKNYSSKTKKSTKKFTKQTYETEKPNVIDEPSKELLESPPVIDANMEIWNRITQKSGEFNLFS